MFVGLLLTKAFVTDAVIYVKRNFPPRCKPILPSFRDKDIAISARVKNFWWKYLDWGSLCHCNLLYRSEKKEQKLINTKTFWSIDTTNNLHHTKTSQLICNANQLTGIYIMGNIDRSWAKYGAFRLNLFNFSLPPLS